MFQFVHGSTFLLQGDQNQALCSAVSRLTAQVSVCDPWSSPGALCKGAIIQSRASVTGFPGPGEGAETQPLGLIQPMWSPGLGSVRLNGDPLQFPVSR